MAQDKQNELESLLDSVSYEITAARSAGLAATSELRAALKRARSLVADAEALASSVEAERLAAEE